FLEHVSSFVIESSPLEVRSASRAARAAIIAGGSASLAIRGSIDPSRAPRPVADDPWQEQVEEAVEDAIDTAAGLSASQAKRDPKAAGLDTNAQSAPPRARLSTTKRTVREPAQRAHLPRPASSLSSSKA